MNAMNRLTSAQTQAPNFGYHGPKRHKKGVWGNGNSTDYGPLGQQTYWQDRDQVRGQKT